MPEFPTKPGTFIEIQKILKTNKSVWKCSSHNKKYQQNYIAEHIIFENSSKINLNAFALKCLCGAERNPVALRKLCINLGLLKSMLPHERQQRCIKSNPEKHAANQQRYNEKHHLARAETQKCVREIHPFTDRFRDWWGKFHARELRYFIMFTVNYHKDIKAGFCAGYKGTKCCNVPSELDHLSQKSLSFAHCEKQAPVMKELENCIDSGGEIQLQALCHKCHSLKTYEHSQEEHRPHIIKHVALVNKYKREIRMCQLTDENGNLCCSRIADICSEGNEFDFDFASSTMLDVTKWMQKRRSKWLLFKNVFKKNRYNSPYAWKNKEELLNELKPEKVRLLHHECHSNATIMQFMSSCNGMNEEEQQEMERKKQASKEDIEEVVEMKVKGTKLKQNKTLICLWLKAPEYLIEAFESSAFKTKLFQHLDLKKKLLRKEMLFYKKEIQNAPALKYSD